jgi:hypothetical protein
VSHLFSQANRDETVWTQPNESGYAGESLRRLRRGPERTPEPQALADWPVLGMIRQLGTAAAPAEPAPLQILRRMGPAQVRPAMAALEGLPTLGAGERLNEPVKSTMETLLGRELSSVQLYSSPAAQALGAAAFTTGERIVFAPGRKDLTSREGLTLLGHELAHLGQTLGFRPLAETSSWTWDMEEHTARQQEQAIERHFEQVWPPAQMEFRREVQVPSNTAQTSGGAASPAMAQWPEVNTAQEVNRVPATQASLGEPPVAENEPGGAAGGEIGRPVEATTPGTGSGTPAPANLEALARQVYVILKKELRAERDRHQLYDR